jgi:tRNA-dihydrouridine synthase B
VPLYLGPQAGVSESPFRRLCRGFGADVVVSEFVSSRRGDPPQRPRTHGYLRFHDDERPIGIQIFGADPQAMAEAAALVEEVYEPDFLDINFGCPVKKVVSRNGGSGCLRDLDLVERHHPRGEGRHLHPHHGQDPQRLERGDSATRWRSRCAARTPAPRC